MQEVKNLRFDGDEIGPPPEFPQVRIQGIAFE